MDFINAMKEESMKFQLGTTENGAIVYTSCGNKLTDFNFHISSYRDKNEQDIINDFKYAYLENQELAIRYLFFVGDIRQGLGERHIFKSLFKYLANEETELAQSVMKFIPEYGRWDELVDLLDTKLQNDTVKIIKDQLSSDLKNAKEGKTISLCAKWLPSINASNCDARRKALILCNKLNMSKKEYRQTLSYLRDKLNIIEKALSEKDIAKLDKMQECFSSKQNYKYANALMNLMPEKRNEYLNKVLTGEANYNADTLEPHEIYYRYRYKINKMLMAKKPDMNYEVMWKMLPNKVKQDNKVLVMRDGSGSMLMPIPGTNNGQLIDVSSALTVYFSQNTEGKYKDKFITFSAKPEIVDLSKCKNLYDKIRLLETYNDYRNTNLEKAFDLILQTAINNNMTQEDLPNNLLIISDMEFDCAINDFSFYQGKESNWNVTLFDKIREKYEKAGYKIPRIIFWNVDNRSHTIPEIKNELGLVLIGGYSKNNIDMICNDDFTVETINEDGKKEIINLKPEEVLANKLMSERYDVIGEAIRPILEKQTF